MWEPLWPSPVPFSVSGIVSVGRPSRVLLKATGLVVQQISRGIHMWACVENPADSVPEHRIAGCKIKKKTGKQDGW